MALLPFCHEGRFHRAAQAVNRVSKDAEDASLLKVGALEEFIEHGL